MECYCYLNVEDLYRMGKLLANSVSEKTFSGPVIPVGTIVQYHPIYAKDQSSLQQFG